MSTLQHIAQPVFRTRAMLAIVMAGAVVAMTIALIVSGSGSASSVLNSGNAHPSQAEITRQLESVSGARYGTVRPGTPAAITQTPQQQLEAVAGARYGLTH